jgi:hypothetical protein
LLEALPLPLARGHHPAANLRRALGRRRAAQLLILHRRNLDVNVDAVEQRAGDFGHVALDHGRRAHALARLVVEVAAGAGIHGRRQHEARRKAERHGGARDGHRVIFERLAHDLEHVARKLRQLVQKEQAVVGQRNLAGAGNDAAADQAGVGDGVVRRAETGRCVTRPAAASSTPATE